MKARTELRLRVFVEMLPCAPNNDWFSIIRDVANRAVEIADILDQAPKQSARDAKGRFVAQDAAEDAAIDRQIAEKIAAEGVTVTTFEWTPDRHAAVDPFAPLPSALWTDPKIRQPLERP